MDLLSICIWVMNLTAWIWTLVDINKSEFKKQNGKTWFTLVLLIPFPAMGFYYWLGIRQKVKPPFKFSGKVH